MTGPYILFFILAALSALASLLVVFHGNVVHSALALIVVLFLTAVLFVTLEAPMVAALQILVYAGAIMVVFLFVIMLLSPRASEPRTMFWWGLGLVAALLLALELVSLFVPTPPTDVPLREGFGSPEMLAQSLFTDFVLPFEIASVLLLVALIGAVVLGKREG